MKDKIKIGCIARCQNGELGIIYKKVKSYYRSEGTIFYGFTFGGKKWQSKKPEFIAGNINEYIWQNY